MTDTIELTVERFIPPSAPTDTVIVFVGRDDDGGRKFFGADHRVAQDLVDALERGEEPVAEVPAWAILGGTE